MGQGTYIVNELVVPFVTVVSAGGVHDDDAYAAGWEMGVLDALLERTTASSHNQVIQTSNVPQADLIALRYGWTLEAEELSDGWTNIQLKNGSTDDL